MKFSIRTMLVLFMLLACCIPLALDLYRRSIQPEWIIQRSAKYSARNTVPYIGCVTARDRPFGNPRVIVLHRVTDLYKDKFPNWLEYDIVGAYIRINGKHVYAAENTIVYYAENDAPPKVAKLELHELPRQGQFSTDPDAIWKAVIDHSEKQNTN